MYDSDWYAGPVPDRDEGRMIREEKRPGPPGLDSPGRSLYIWLIEFI